MEWWSTLFQQTISSYPDHKPRGMQACERLLSAPGLPYEIELATRRNQTWYCRRLADHGEGKKIDFPRRRGWSLFNPSIAIGPDDRMAMIVRSSNYRINDAGYYEMPSEDGDVVKTENYLLDMGSNLDAEYTVARMNDSAVTNADNPFPARGLEDCRLFWRHDWQFLATVRDRDQHGFATILRCWLDGTDVVDSTQLSTGCDHQKNWMPLTGHQPGNALCVVTRCYPLTIQAGWGDFGWWYTSPFIARSFRGSSQVIRLGNQRRLAVIHESVTMEPYQMVYTHRFVEFSTQRDVWRIRRLSDPFVFEDRQIEFCAGMCQLGDDLVLSYGVRDAEARLLRIPRRFVTEELLREPVLPELPL